MCVSRSQSSFFFFLLFKNRAVSKLGLLLGQKSMSTLWFFPRGDWACAVLLVQQRLKGEYRCHLQLQALKEQPRFQNCWDAVWKHYKNRMQSFENKLCLLCFLGPCCDILYTAVFYKVVNDCVMTPTPVTNEPVYPWNVPNRWAYHNFPTLVAPSNLMKTCCGH